MHSSFVHFLKFSRRRYRLTQLIWKRYRERDTKSRKLKEYTLRTWSMDFFLKLIHRAVPQLYAG